MRRSGEPAMLRRLVELCLPAADVAEAGIPTLALERAIVRRVGGRSGLALRNAEVGIAPFVARAPLDPDQRGGRTAHQRGFC